MTNMQTNNSTAQRAVFRLKKVEDLMLALPFCFISAGRLSLKVSNGCCNMMDDINKTEGQFCEVGTAVENIKQEIFRGKNQVKGSYLAFGYVTVSDVFQNH
jgi:hypothetical protein